MKTVLLTLLVILGFTSQTQAAPSIAEGLIPGELVNDEIKIMNGEPKPATNVQAYSFAGGEVWKSDKSYRAKVERGPIENDDVTRITQVSVKGDEVATFTTSYYTDKGMRSHTGCFASIKDGKVGEMHCATASVRLCGVINEVVRSPGKFKKDMAVNDPLLDPRVTKQLKAAAIDGSLNSSDKTRAEYSDLLVKLNDFAVRGQPFERQYNITVDQDQTAISDLVAKNFGLKRIPLMNPVSISGSTLGEMASRSDRIKNKKPAAQSDLRALAYMVSACSQRRFVYPLGKPFPSVLPEEGGATK